MWLIEGQGETKPHVNRDFVVVLLIIKIIICLFVLFSFIFTSAYLFDTQFLTASKAVKAAFWLREFSAEGTLIYVSMVPHQRVKIQIKADRSRCSWLLSYSTIFPCLSILTALLSYAILNEWLLLFTVHFSMSTKVVYLQCYLVVTWLVPCETAVILVHILCTPYNHAPDYSVTSFEAT